MRVPYALASHISSSTLPGSSSEARAAVLPRHRSQDKHRRGGEAPRGAAEPFGIRVPSPAIRHGRGEAGRPEFIARGCSHQTRGGAGLTALCVSLKGWMDSEILSCEIYGFTLPPSYYVRSECVWETGLRKRATSSSTEPPNLLRI